MDGACRRRRVLAGGGVLLAAGLAYALWVRFTGLALPCPFHAATGLLCPGCGVTRMCLALLRGDPAGAWAANPVLLLLLPVLGLLAVRMALRYVREGRTLGPHWENVLCWLLIALLAAWGVARNLL